MKVIDQELYDRLEKHDQLHVIRFINELSNKEREELLAELSELDLPRLDQRLRQALETASSSSCQQTGSPLQPVSQDRRGVHETESVERLAEYEQIGLEAIRLGKVAVILLAGGQGTRLGVTYPKGMYSVDLLSKKSLYQLQAERLLKVKQLAHQRLDQNVDLNQIESIPWYIMASEATLDSTRDYFVEHNYFGLNQENVVFFEQGMLPCLTPEGRLILDQKSKLSKSPDGNGGLYKALVSQGVLDDMKRRGVEYVHVYCVDNILVKMADPVYTGFCIHKNSDCAAKVVKKTDPEEKVGVICQINGQYQVVEYSEISEENRLLRDENDDLVYNAGNICNHFFTYQFLDRVSRLDEEKQLSYHIAEKKIPFVNENGDRVTPKEPNGIKLEKFVFDVFPLAQRFAIWEVERHEEFAPLKNGYDAKKDNPITCRQNLYAQHHRWLKNAGASFDNNNNQYDENNNTASSSSHKVAFEISPLVSYNGEGLEEMVRGRTLPTLLQIELDQQEARPIFITNHP